jgi:hypothetical protein
MKCVMGLDRSSLHRRILSVRSRKPALETIQRLDLFQVENQMAINRVPPVLHKDALVRPLVLSQAASTAVPISNEVV